MLDGCIVFYVVFLALRSIHSPPPIHLHGVVLNSLSTETTLPYLTLYIAFAFFLVHPAFIPEQPGLVYHIQCYLFWHE
jgi:hypothetical protein